MSSTNKSPKVSIIIPIYNGEKYVTDAIKSIRHQTYQNWELLIIDDGSTDNTIEVISAIPDERIRVHKAGRIGVNGRVKNIGLSLAAGELIAFSDHDDLWEPTKLEKQVTALNQQPEAGFCLTGGYNFKTEGQPAEYFYKQKEGMKYGDLFVPFFRSEVSAFVQALMIRKECIDVAGPFKDVRSFTDVDFIINISRHFKGVILYEPLVFRRIHDENHSYSNWEKGNQSGLDIIHAYKQFLPRTVTREALFRLYINFGEQHRKRTESKKAISKFFKAWKYKPMSIIPLKKMAKAILFHLKN